MKKILKKKILKSSNAIKYFSPETLTQSITIIDGTCYMVDGVKSCSC